MITCFLTFEPPHDKTNKITVRPSKTQISLDISPVWSESSLSAWKKLTCLATHWAHSEDWSDWANAQADLSLRWEHSDFVGFVMRWLIYLTIWQGFFCQPKISMTKVAKSVKDTNCFFLSLFTETIPGNYWAASWESSGEYLFLPYANNKGVD